MNERLRSPRTALLLALLGLSIGGAVAHGVLPAALAAPAPESSVFEGPALLELLRPSDVVGDGSTPVDLYVLALHADGTPVVGMALKLTPTGGLSTLPEDTGGGLYHLVFTPSLTASPTTASVALKGKLPNKTAIDRTWSFPIAPPRNRALAVSASPSLLTLGVDKTASVAFTFSGGDPRALAGVRLNLNSTAGTLANVTNVGNGVFNGLYTTPAVSAPQLGIIAAVDSGDPMRTYGTLAIPLTANVTQPVSGPANTPVVLRVGGRDFGPVKTDSKGRAKIPIVLPPGVTSATRVMAGADGVVTEQPFDLKVAETRRIALFPTVAAIPSDSRLQVPIRAVVYTAEGKPDDMATVEFSVTAGTIGPARPEGGGVYVATYSPPDGNLAVKASFQVKLVGGAALQAETRPLLLVPVRAGRVALNATPAVLPAAATSLTVTALVAGPTGAPLAGRALTFSANGARLQGVTDMKSGSYDAVFTTTGTGPVEVSASVAAPATGNQMTQLLVIPSQKRLPADGVSSSMLTVATLDEFGYPVPNVEVDLTLSTGEGSVPERATTNSAGVVEVYYTAGRKSGVTHIDAHSGALSAGVSIVIAPAALSLPAMPTSASAATRSFIDDWAWSFAALRVERE